MGVLEFAVFYAQVLGIVLGDAYDYVARLLGVAYEYHTANPEHWFWLYITASGAALLFPPIRRFIKKSADFPDEYEDDGAPEEPGRPEPRRAASTVEVGDLAMSKHAFCCDRVLMVVPLGAVNTLNTKWCTIVPAANPTEFAARCREVWGIEWIVLEGGAHVATCTLDEVHVVAVSAERVYTVISNTLYVINAADVRAVSDLLQ